MPDSSYTTKAPPTPDEIAPWRRQKIYLWGHNPGDPIDPENPQLGIDHQRTWGFPAWQWPPADAMDYLIGVFKREIAQCATTEYLRPKFRFAIEIVALAHFAWFAANEGAEWLLGFFGVERIDPHPGFVYVYIDPRTGSYYEISKRTGMDLTMFQSCAREYQAPIVDQQSPHVEEFKTFLESHRSPYSPMSEPIQHPASGMYTWVSGKITEWLLAVTADLDWPFPKPDRISGPKWARTTTKADGTLRYTALSKLEEFGHRAYRIEDGNKNVIWCGPNDMRMPPLIDVERSNGVSESELQLRYRCSSCGAIRTCTVTTGTGQRLCRHCVGVQLEKNERPMLDWCLYSECKRCTDYFDSPDKLGYYINQLNKPVYGKVSR